MSAVSPRCKYSYFLALMIFALGFSPAGQGQIVSAEAGAGFELPGAFLLPAAFKTRLSGSTHWRIHFSPLDIPPSGIPFTFWLDSKDFLPVSFAEVPDNCLHSSSVSASCTLEPEKNLQLTVAAESLFPALAIWHSARDPQQQPVRAFISVTPLSPGGKTPEFIDWQSRPEAVHELEQLHLRLQQLSKGDSDPLPNTDELETYARAQHNFISKNSENNKTGQLLEIPPDAWFSIRFPGQSSTFMDYGEPVDMDNSPPAKQEKNDPPPSDKKSTESQQDSEQRTDSTQPSLPRKAASATSGAAKRQNPVSSTYPGPGLPDRVSIAGIGDIPTQMHPLLSATETVNRLSGSHLKLSTAPDDPGNLCIAYIKEGTEQKRVFFPSGEIVRRMKNTRLGEEKKRLLIVALIQVIDQLPEHLDFGRIRVRPRDCSINSVDVIIPVQRDSHLSSDGVKQMAVLFEYTDLGGRISWPGQNGAGITSHTIFNPVQETSGRFLSPGQRPASESACGLMNTDIPNHQPGPDVFACIPGIGWINSKMFIYPEAARTEKKPKTPAPKELTIMTDTGSTAVQVIRYWADGDEVIRLFPASMLADKLAEASLPGKSRKLIMVALIQAFDLLPENLDFDSVEVVVRQKNAGQITIPVGSTMGSAKILTPGRLLYLSLGLSGNSICLSWKDPDNSVKRTYSITVRKSAADIEGFPDIFTGYLEIKADTMLQPGYTCEPVRTRTSTPHPGPGWVFITETLPPEVRAGIYKELREAGIDSTVDSDEEDDDDSAINASEEAPRLYPGRGTPEIKATPRLSPLMPAPRRQKTPSPFNAKDFMAQVRRQRLENESRREQQTMQKQRAKEAAESQRREKILLEQQALSRFTEKLYKKTHNPELARICHESSFDKPLVCKGNDVVPGHLSFPSGYFSAPPPDKRREK